MLSALLTAILPTFGIIGVGWLCRYWKIWNRGAVHALNGYAYAIALPALIFQAVFDLDLIATATGDDVRYLVGLVAAHSIVALLAVVATIRARPELRAIAPMLVTFGSTAYLGIPFATYAFGETGTAYAAIGSVVLVVTMLFVSLATLNRSAPRPSPTHTLVQLLELPFLWVVLLGLLLPVVGIHTLPEWLRTTIGVLAGSAGPTALLALGAFNYDLDLRAIPWRTAIALGTAKVLLPSIATYIILRILGVHGIRLAVGTALAATSIAVTAFVLADARKIGRSTVAGALAISTIVSLIALSVITVLWNSATRAF